MEKGNSRRVQYLVTLSVSIATITMGMSSAWPTPVIPKFHDNETRLAISKDEIAWMLAFSSPGFMAGSFVTGFALDGIGRRATLLWSALPYGLGIIVVACALEPWLLYITQFLWSCGTGMLSNVITLYFAEISDKEIRGSLFLVTKFTFHLGSLLMMCIGPFVSYEILNYMLLVLPVCYFLACWWIPESPYYYLKEGKVDAARKTLEKLKGYKDSKSLEDELLQMQSDVKKEMRRSGSAKELFTGRQYHKAIIIAAGLKVSQIMTGAMTIQQYLGLIMKESQVNMELYTVTIIFGASRFLVSIMPSVLADDVGRRPLLIYSLLGTALSLATVGLYFFFMEVIRTDHSSLTPYGFITFVGIISANIISTIGFQSVINVIPGEIFPLNVKATAMTSLSIFGGMLSFVVARGYQALKDVIGLCGVFWVFASVALFSAVFTFFYVPETKGKSLREIQEQLQGDLYKADEASEKLNGVELNGVMSTDYGVSEGRELDVLNKKNDST